MIGVTDQVAVVARIRRGIGEPTARALLGTANHIALGSGVETSTDVPADGAALAPVHRGER